MESTGVGALDPTTIARARRGDTTAFTLIVQRYQTPVYNLAYRMLGDAAEAEDAAQETFLRAYAQLKTYRAEIKFATWLLSIAAHYCIDRLRRTKFRGFSLDDERAGDIFPADAPGPEETALRHEREIEIQQILQRLAPAARAVVVLKYWNDLSVEEIAAATGDSVSAVKVKLFRARRAMAREFQRRTQTARASRLGLKGAITDAR